MAIVGLMGVTSKSVVVVSTAACGRRVGGGLALDGLFTGLDRAPERTGDSPPRHIPSPTSLRAHHCVPSSVHVRPCSKGPHSPTSSGSASRSKMALNSRSVPQDSFHLPAQGIAVVAGEHPRHPTQQLGRALEFSPKQAQVLIELLRESQGTLIAPDQSPWPKHGVTMS